MHSFLSKKLSLDASEYQHEVDIHLISEKLNALLVSKKITTKILSNATGVSIAAINNIKRGEGNPTIGTLNVISRFFGISLLELLGLGNSASMQNASSIISIYDLRNADQRNDANVIDKMLIETPKNINQNNIFGIIINNNYLLPLYEKGTIFLVDTSREVIDGDIIFVRILNSINALKRIFIKKESCFLKNINIDDTLESYTRTDLFIIGVIIQIIQKT